MSPRQFYLKTDDWMSYEDLMRDQQEFRSLPEPLRARFKKEAFAAFIEVSSAISDFRMGRLSVSTVYRRIQSFSDTMRGFKNRAYLEAHVPAHHWELIPFDFRFVDTKTD